MKYDPSKHYRRSIRLKGNDYSQPGAYFITICTKNRECLFGEIKNGEMVLNNKGKIVTQCWLEIPSNYLNVELDKFVVMPNHIHGIIIITENNVGAIHELPLQKLSNQHESNEPTEKIKQRRLMTLPRIIGRFKMNSAKQINQLRRTSGMAVWQRNYYEHVIRNEKVLNFIRKYIINNPLQWELDIENPNGRGADLCVCPKR